MLAGGGSPINSALGKPARYPWRVSAHSGLAGGGVQLRWEGMPAEGIILSLSGPDGRNIRSGRVVPRPYGSAVWEAHGLRPGLYVVSVGMGKPAVAGSGPRAQPTTVPLGMGARPTRSPHLPLHPLSSPRTCP